MAVVNYVMQQIKIKYGANEKSNPRIKLIKPFGLVNKKPKNKLIEKNPNLMEVCYALALYL